MELLFSVKKHILTRKDSESVFSRSKNYVSILFDFSDDWNGKVKTAIFKKEEQEAPVLLEDDNRCIIPKEILNSSGLLRIGVIGVGDGEKIVTNNCIVQVYAGSEFSESDNTFSTSLLDQVLNKLAEIQNGLVSSVDIAKCVQEYFVEHNIGDVDTTKVVALIEQYVSEHPLKDGANGKSAYELWLEAGNVGNENDFLNSLVGKTGERGIAGKNGLPGIDGRDGQDGLSAYEIAIKNGFQGSESEWLDSLRGKDGESVKGDPGEQGESGKDGLSAYDIWLAEGNTGSKRDFLASLKGEKGDAGSGTGGNTDVDFHEIDTQSLIDYYHSCVNGDE